MIDTGAYAQRMARYLHLKDSPVYATLGSGNSALAVTRLHAPGGYSLISNSMEIFFGVMETNQVRTIPIAGGKTGYGLKEKRERSALPFR
jgi:hypothetical protein